MPRDFVPCAYDEWEAPLPYGEGLAVFGMLCPLTSDGTYGEPHGWHWVEIGPEPYESRHAREMLRWLIFDNDNAAMAALE